jgi:hypothetical protein
MQRVAQMAQSFRRQREVAQHAKAQRRNRFRVTVRLRGTQKKSAAIRFSLNLGASRLDIPLPENFSVRG